MLQKNWQNSQTYQQRQRTDGVVISPPMAEPAADRSSSDDALQKEINRREVFERKSAELEGVNDELRVENGVSLSY